MIVDGAIEFSVFKTSFSGAPRYAFIGQATSITWQRQPYIVRAFPKCHCGRDGNPADSFNCTVHGDVGRRKWREELKRAEKYKDGWAQ